MNSRQKIFSGIQLFDLSSSSPFSPSSSSFRLRSETPSSSIHSLIYENRLSIYHSINLFSFSSSASGNHPFPKERNTSLRNLVQLSGCKTCPRFASLTSPLPLGRHHPLPTKKHKNKTKQIETNI